MFELLFETVIMPNIKCIRRYSVTALLSW